MPLPDLSGLWQGVSRSHDASKQPTFWYETTFKFCRDGEVIGEGVSQWKQQLIPFSIHGRVDSATCKFSFTKQHKGIYQNTIDYWDCFVDGTELVGSFSSGELTLTKGERGPVARNIDTFLSGEWTGISRKPTSSGKTTITHWTEFSLRFCSHGSCSRGSVFGGGSSIWNEQTIPFSITGEFDWKGKVVCLRKAHHHSKYTNTVVLDGRLTVDSERIEIHGEFIGGEFSLSKNATVSAVSLQSLEEEGEDPVSVAGESDGSRRSRATVASRIASCCSGLWEGNSTHCGNTTVWEPFELTFGFHPVSFRGTLRGEGVSSWSGGKTSFVLDKGIVEWRNGEVEWVKRHRGGASPDPIRYKLLLELPEGLSAAVSRLCEEREVLEDEYGELMAGIGEGEHSVLLRGSSVNKELQVDVTLRRVGGAPTSSAPPAVEVGERPREGKDEDADMCKICFVKTIDSIILPCGHYCACSLCSARMPHCPICRCPITKIQKIYRS